jgi:hypothetical protein
MIKYNNLIIYGLSKKDLPAKGYVIHFGQKGVKHLYQFYSEDRPFTFLTKGIEHLTQFLPDPPSNQYVCIQKGFIQPVFNCEIISYAHYFYGKQKQDVTIFAIKEDGNFIKNGKVFTVKHNKIIKK